MTKWQEQIDDELGKERKFTQELEVRIIERTKKKHRTNWQVRTAFAGLVIVLLFLVLVGPTKNEIQVQTIAPFEEMLQMTDVKEFYVSIFPTGKEHFTARDSSLYIGTKHYDDIKDVAYMQKVLESMVLVEDVKSYGVEWDVLVEMEDQQQLKLKFYDYGSWLGIKDLHSKLFYMIDDPDILLDFRADYDKELNTLIIYTIGILLGIINIILNYVSFKVFYFKHKKLSKEDTWPVFLKGVAIFIFLGSLFYALFNTIIVHKAVIVGGIILLAMFDIMLEKLFETNRQHIKIQIIRYVAMIIAITIVLIVI